MKAIKIITIIALTTFPLSLGLAQPVPTMAPPYQGSIGSATPATGFVRPAVDLPHLDGRVLPARFALVVPPDQWDWRAEGRVSPVRDQGACGACYAFASLANIESKMLIDGEGLFDFSENNVKECNWYQTGCGGGNYDMMADFLAKSGVVLEACDPYVAGDVPCSTGCAFQKTLLDWHIISTSSVPATDVLQQYIYDNGPVYTAIYAGDGSDPAWTAEFSGYDGSYTLYYTGAYEPNHAVSIVGWDNDLVHAGGTGGWICKNSWGTGWGGACGYGVESGYFTIAYGSASIGTWSSYAESCQDYDDQGELLYYDEGGWSSNWGYNNVTAWGMAEYVPSAATYLTRVEFWTNDITTDVDIYVYDDFDGSQPSTLLASSLDHSYAEAGYHSVSVTTPPQLSTGDTVYAVVKITNLFYKYPLAADNQGPNETGMTYMSNNGAAGSWYDLGLNQSNDLGLRIRTSSTVGVPYQQSAELPRSILLHKSYPNPFNSISTIEYTLAAESQVSLAIYDLLGRRVAALANGKQPAGSHKLQWQADVPSGFYFYKIQADDQVGIGSMLLLK